MANSFEDLITLAARDGASAPCAAWLSHPATELADLFVAWQKECHHAIESQMLLDRACRLLGRMLAEGELSSQSARSAKSLIEAAKAARLDARSTGGS